MGLTLSPSLLRYSWKVGLGGGGVNDSSDFSESWYYGTHGVNIDTAGDWTYDVDGLGDIWGNAVTYGGGVITGMNESSGTILGAVADEHCDVKQAYPAPAKTDLPQGSPSSWREFDAVEKYNRTADSAWVVQTGGRGLPAQQSLWRFFASAATIINPRTVPPYYFGVPQVGIPYGSIVIPGIGRLQADGTFWKVLPAGQTSPVTPSVLNNDFYLFTIGGSKYTLSVAMNGNGNNYNDLSATNPEFCVGQQLTFAPQWDIDPGAESVDVRWHLPGKYVNEQYQPDPSSSCTSYHKNDDLLTNAITQCWYVRDPGGVCSVREILYFSNGQSVNIAAAGSFLIYRPQAQFQNMSSCVVALNNATLSLDFPIFKATVSSADFSGDLNWVQLIKRQAFGNGLWLQNTYGNFYLDNDPFYNTESDNMVGAPPQNTPVTTQTEGIINFDDNPQVGCVPLNTWINDSFKTYLVFKPQGDGIWITLGEVTWGWSALASYTYGWQLDSSSVSPPQYGDTDEFPVWPDVLHNH